MNKIASHYYKFASRIKNLAEEKNQKLFLVHKDEEEEKIMVKNFIFPRRILIPIILYFFLILLGLSFSRADGEEKNPTDFSKAIISVAQKNIPAVVHIEVTERQEVINPFLPFESDPFFRYFFNIPRLPKKFKREVKGLGSGMIIDAEGHILTNHHVVGGATKIEVILADGRKFAGSLVGTDPKTDLAIIKISAREPLPHVTFGDSDKVEIGEWVVAIGHPRGLDQTVSHGIISAKHRRGITDPSSYQDFLQTDAAINPGNSGGPLLNLKGEVIGVNAAIVSESGGFEGIGFAIPSNMALHVAKALITHHKVERGWIGVNVQDLTEELAKSLHLENTKGALIVNVIKGGPADKAGLKKNDVIIAYQGKEIKDASSLRNEVANTAIGQEVKVNFMRNGIKQELLVKIGNLEEASKFLISMIKERLGAEVRTLTSKESQKFNLEPQRGVVITSINPKGPLGEAGLETGDIILEINGQPIMGMESFVQILISLKANQRITLLALDHRSGDMGYVKVVVR